MAEGPELWFLSNAINTHYEIPITSNYGKHMFIHSPEAPTIKDWTYGLKGKVKISKDLSMRKVASGSFLVGYENDWANIEEARQNLGVNWMMAPFDDIIALVNSWKTSKRTLGALLTDQSEIAGVGIVWACEILGAIYLDPTKKACEQELTYLAGSLLNFRVYAKHIYSEYLFANQEHLDETVNAWPDNILPLRELVIYGKCDQVKLGNRQWYKRTFQ